MLSGILRLLAPIAPFVLAFISLFVAVNAFGNLPLYLNLTDGMNTGQRHKIVLNSIFAAGIIAMLFMLFGNIFLRLMGVTVPDFRIAGGILLLVLAVHLLLPGEDKRGRPNTDIGVFPLGTPLITGPAVLTTVLILREAYGIIPTALSIIINMVIMWFVLWKADLMVRVLGKGGARAMAKVSDIFLAAIAVMMIRLGLIEIIAVFMAAKK